VLDTFSAIDTHSPLFVRAVERKSTHSDCGSTLGLLVVGGCCSVDVRGQVSW
jgi:hypothetical protein